MSGRRREQWAVDAQSAAMAGHLTALADGRWQMKIDTRRHGTVVATVDLSSEPVIVTVAGRLVHPRVDPRTGRYDLLASAEGGLVVDFPDTLYLFLQADLDDPSEPVGPLREGRRGRDLVCDPGALEMARFGRMLRQIGLRIERVPGDGHCLFTAVGRQARRIGLLEDIGSGSSVSYESMRRRTAQHMRDHRGDFEPFVPSNVPFAVYCDAVETTSLWGGELEIRALADALSCSIQVFRVEPTEQLYTIPDFDDGSRELTIHLSYHCKLAGGRHYNMIVPLDR